MIQRFVTEKILSKKLVLKRGVTAVALTLSSAQVVMAQEAPAESDIPKVIVTGSNIARINAEGPTPVEVISRKDIQKSGATTVVEMLSKMPSVGVSLDGNNYNSFAGGASSVALRGLDAKYTLILLNGRRLANYGFANNADSSFVDLNNIPLAALDSVEILRDGASAIYGSDAVAGVINFKTRSNYQGVEGTANVGINQKGDGSTGNASVTAGWGDLDSDGYNILSTLDVMRRNALRSDKHSATQAHDFTAYGGSDKRPTNQYLGWVRNYSVADPGYVIPGCIGTPGVSSTGDNVCFTNPATQLTPSLERVGFSTIVTKRLNAQSELFAEIGFNHNKSTYSQGFPRFSSQLLVPTAGSTNPALLGLPGESDELYGFTPGDRLQVVHAITEAGEQIETIKSNTVRLVGGWRGTLGSWDSELSTTFNRNKLTDVTTNGVLADVSSASLIDGVGGRGGYDPFIFNNPASVVSPMLTDFNHQAVSKLSTVEWKMSKGQLFSYDGRPIGFAWGGQASHESIDDVPDRQTLAGNIVNQGATGAVASRTVYSLYGELNVPLRKDLEMQAALRGDRYSDFGSSFNPKVALAWRPSEQVLLRTSATTSFKAPTLPQIGARTTAYTTVADYARCGPLGYTGPTCSYSPKLYLTGNPDLKPEKANNFSAGMVLQPMKNLSMSLDWYDIHQRDTIQSLDAQYVLDNEDIIPGFAAMIGRDPRNPALEAANPGLNKGRINNLTLPFINVGQTKTQGLDLDLKYDVSLGEAGKLRFHEVNNYTLSYKQSIAPGESPVDRRDSIFHPKWNNSFRAAYELGAHEVGLTARTAASTLNIDDPTHTQDESITNARIGSYTVWDLNYSWKASKKLDLNVGVNNVFDKGVVYANTAYQDSYVQGLNDLVGRYIYVNARYVFN